jgi:hypothetical protein
MGTLAILPILAGTAGAGLMKRRREREAAFKAALENMPPHAKHL